MIRIAVYADSPENFTTLAIAHGLAADNNDYARYIEALYTQASHWESPNLVVDDDAHFPPDDRDERRQLSLWYHHFKQTACKTMPLLRTTNWTQKFCRPSQNYDFGTPKSRYRPLISQYNRTSSLQKLFPKYKRSPTPTKPLTKSGFVLSIYRLFLDLKAQASKEHGIDITSAVLSVPAWIPDPFIDLFAEAALLAGVEIFDLQNCVQQSIRLAEPNAKPIMVIDHGQYYLSAHHLEWSEHFSAFKQRFASGSPGFGSRWIWENLATKIIDDFNFNTTEAERVGKQSISRQEFNQVIDARMDLRGATENVNQSKSVNMTDLTGHTRLFNLTIQDVRETEERYEAIVTEYIQHLLLRHDAIKAHLKSRPDWEALSKLPKNDRWRLYLDVAATAPPPTDTGSWLHRVDEIIILDPGWEVEILDRAARKALGWKDGMREREGGKGICVPGVEKAARGAALRAAEWVKMWEERQQEAKRMLEMRDKSLRTQGWDGVECRGRFLKSVQEGYMREQSENKRQP